MTVFGSLADSSKIVNAVSPSLGGLLANPDIIADLAREELLQSHCDRFRAAIDLVTRVALDVHTAPSLADNQRALITIGVGDRTGRTKLEQYLKPLSPTLTGLSDPQELWSILGCNCLTGQKTDAVHWLYNVILGFDWEWSLGEAAIRNRLGL